MNSNIFDKSKYYREIIHKLERLEFRETTLLVLKGIQYTLIISILSFFFFSLIELIFNFSSNIRTFLFYFWLFGSLVLLIAFVLFPFIKYFLPISNYGKVDHLKTAKKVGNLFPEVKDDLLNAMQLVAADNVSLYSVGLIDAAFQNIYQRIKELQFETAIKFDSARKLLNYVIPIILFTGLIFLFSSDLRFAAYRLQNYDIEFVAPPKIIFIVEPGNTQITKGENVLVKIKTEGEQPNLIKLFFKDETQTNFLSANIIKDSTGFFNYEFTNIQNSINYYVSFEKYQSEKYLIDVIDRPNIQTFTLQIIPPSYTHLKLIEQKDNGNIEGIYGSQIKISLLSNKELKSAELSFTDSTKITLKLNSNFAEGTFRITTDNEYKIILVDKLNYTNLSPINYSIKIINDEYPTIEVISPNDDINLDNNERLPLLLKISDDFGFTKLILKYRLSSSKYELEQKEFQSIEIPTEKNNKENNINYIWNLSPLNLATEDVVSYYLEVYDNDNVSGPKSTKTKIFTVRLPSIDEIFTQTDESHQQIEEEMVETLKQAEELKKNLDKISNDLKKDKKEISWQEKENIEKSLEQFEQLQNKVEDINKKLNEMKENLQKNDLLSKETLEKYMELQQLMNEMTSEEYKKAMEQLQSLLQKMDRKQIQDALENMKFDEEQFQKSLDRTLNLLKRIKVEQKIDELLKRAEDVTNKQEQLQKETNESNLNDKKDLENLQQKQSEISDDINNMKENLKEMEDLMKDLKDMPKEELDKLMEEFEKQQNEKLSEEALEELQKMQPQKAMQNQQQISQNMQKMQKGLQQLQQSIMQQNQMKTFADMMRLMDNIITLSKQEEELKQQTGNNKSNSFNNESIQKQDEIKRNLEKIMKQMGELAQKTFAITPEMGKALGDAYREMNKSEEAMQNRNGSMAANAQGNAMKSLNEAAKMMKGMMDQMAQGNGQGGMMSLMQQLGQLSQMQMNLNNLTQMLQQALQQGNLSMEQQAQLQRLSQQQDIIRKSLEQLNEEAKESGKSKTLPSNVNDILKQMEEVITDMKTENLDDDLIQKQERILSKLLDAQRSINERDFEKNRESKSGENITRQSPETLEFSNKDRLNKLRDEYNNLIRENWNKDYENLIRKYFEALEKEKLN
ncbi:MAG: hypothetical protein STSR0008_00460 [Ignavibacterium sp.]